MTTRTTGALIVAALLAGTAHAAPSAAQACVSAKDVAMATFAKCRLKADGAFAKAGDVDERTAAYGKCADKLAKAYGVAETKYGAACPTGGDESRADDFVRACTERARDWTAATPGAVLHFVDFVGSGATQCFGGGDTTGTEPTAIPCAGTNQDPDGALGVAPAFVDDGDGTITDLHTGLQWEKKSDDGSLHDKNAKYPWVATCTGDDATLCTRDGDCAGVGGTCGTTAFTWLDRLNAAGFAGHSDWRLPSVRELASVVDYGSSAPAVPAEFDTNCGDRSSGNRGCTVLDCSCTADGSSARYWSSTTSAATSDSAWSVAFVSGTSLPAPKSLPCDVRAVRNAY